MRGLGGAVIIGRPGKEKGQILTIFRIDDVLNQFSLSFKGRIHGELRDALDHEGTSLSMRFRFSPESLRAGTGRGGEGR